MTESVYDLIIIGGGISGIGVALESDKQGYKTLLLEKGKFLSAASANNLRIIHGGYRYLQTMSLKRIVESIKAQNRLLKTYPEFIKKMPCILPLNKIGLKSSPAVAAANLMYATLYRLLTAQSCGNKILRSEAAESEVPVLHGKCRNGALIWYDAMVEELDSFHSAQMTQILSSENIKAVENCAAEEISREGHYIKVRAGEKDFITKAVINCSGAWLEKIKVNLPEVVRKPQKWCKAFNIILNRKIEEKYAIGLQANLPAFQKRTYFMVPREGRTVIGTEYKELDCSLEKLEITELERTEFLNNINAALPGMNLASSDIAGIEAGVLPYLHKGKDGFKLLGREKIYKYGNYFEVLSTKYTTYQIQAERLIKMLQIVK
jgi:glycerol-3-phosphate dehydrogenase